MLVLTPFSYTQLIWMIASGFLIFGDTPGLRDPDRRGHRGRLRRLLFLALRERARGAGAGSVTYAP